jgi:hypothetical protein
MQSDHLPLGKMRSSKSLVVDNNEDSMWKFYPKSIKKISCNHSCELNLHYICDAICIYHVCTPWRECTYLLGTLCYCLCFESTEMPFEIPLRAGWGCLKTWHC